MHNTLKELEKAEKQGADNHLLLNMSRTMIRVLPQYVTVSSPPTRMKCSIGVLHAGDSDKNTISHPGSSIPTPMIEKVSAAHVLWMIWSFESSTSPSSSAGSSSTFLSGPLRWSMEERDLAASEHTDRLRAVREGNVCRGRPVFRGSGQRT